MDPTSVKPVKRSHRRGPLLRVWARVLKTVLPTVTSILAHAIPSADTTLGVPLPSLTSPTSQSGRRDLTVTSAAPSALTSTLQSKLGKPVTSARRRTAAAREQ